MADSPSSAKHSLRSLLPALTFGIALVLTYTLYATAFSGPWLLDDQPNIVQNPGTRLTILSIDSFDQAARSMQVSESDRLSRPISFLSFALDYYWSLPVEWRGLPNVYPADDTPYRRQIKQANLFIHLFTGILLALLTSQLLKLMDSPRKPIPTSLHRWLPPVVAVFWLWHPLMVSTVLYSVQRMTSLSACFTLMGVLGFIHFRNQLKTSGRGMVGGIICITLFTALAYGSKENGVLLPVLCFVIEIAFFRFAFPSPTPRVIRRGYVALISAGPVLLLSGLAHIVLTTSDASMLSNRGYTLLTRFLTQLPILWEYVSWFAYPVNHRLIFLHDTYPLAVWPSVQLILTASGWLLILGLCGWLLARKKAPWLSFAILWFLAGHAMESTVIPLELVFEHRNYLPYMGLAFGLLYWAGSQLTRVDFSAWFKGFLVFMFVFTVPYILTMNRVQHWQSTEQLLAHWQQVNAQSPRVWAQTAEFFYLNQKDPHTAQAALEKAFELAPWEAGYGLAQIALHCGHGETERTLASDEFTTLIQKTLTGLAQRPNTAYTTNQYNNMKYLCSEHVLAPRLAPVFEIAITAGIETKKGPEAPSKQ